MKQGVVLISCTPPTPLFPIATRPVSSIYRKWAGSNLIPYRDRLIDFLLQSTCTADLLLLDLDTRCAFGALAIPVDRKSFSGGLCCVLCCALGIVVHVYV